MKRLTVNISDELHKELKQHALNIDKTVTDYVLDLIKKDEPNREKVKK